jgi:predicted  nucleic acid-binding Zn-ribbon protein
MNNEQIKNLQKDIQTAQESKSALYKKMMSGTTPSKEYEALRLDYISIDERLQILENTLKGAK